MRITIKIWRKSWKNVKKGRFFFFKCLHIWLINISKSISIFSSATIPKSACINIIYICLFFGQICLSSLQAVYAIYIPNSRKLQGIDLLSTDRLSFFRAMVLSWPHTSYRVMVCSRSLYPFYIETHYIKWHKTSWICSKTPKSWFFIWTHIG